MASIVEDPSLVSAMDYFLMFAGLALLGFNWKSNNDKAFKRLLGTDEE